MLVAGLLLPSAPPCDQTTDRHRRRRAQRLADQEPDLALIAGVVGVDGAALERREAVDAPPESTGSPGPAPGCRSAPARARCPRRPARRRMRPSARRRWPRPHRRTLGAARRPAERERARLRAAGRRAHAASFTASASRGSSVASGSMQRLSITPHVFAEVVDVDRAIDEAHDAVVDVADLPVGVPAVGRAGPERAQHVPDRQAVDAGRHLATPQLRDADLLRRSR